MTATTVDEETPLLPDQQKKKPTPLPLPQFAILLVLQLAEPLTSQVIYPFLPQVSRPPHVFVCLAYFPMQLVRDVGITHGDETRVGLYVGLMVSLLGCLHFPDWLTSLARSNPYSSRHKQ